MIHLLGESGRLPVGNILLGGAQMNYLGIDHHRQYSHLTLMDENGIILRHDPSSFDDVQHLWQVREGKEQREGEVKKGICDEIATIIVNKPVNK